MPVVREDADEVLIPDFGNRRVAVFDKDGNWLRNYGSQPEKGFYLDEVNAVFVGPDARMLVLDTTNRDLHPGCHRGSDWASCRLSEAGFGPIDTSGIAVSPTGRLYLSTPPHRIVEAQLEPPLWPVEAATTLT